MNSKAARLSSLLCLNPYFNNFLSAISKIQLNKFIVASSLSPVLVINSLKARIGTGRVAPSKEALRIACSKPQYADILRISKPDTVISGPHMHSMLSFPLRKFNTEFQEVFLPNPDPIYLLPSNIKHTIKHNCWRQASYLSHTNLDLQLFLAFYINLFLKCFSKR